MSVSIFENRDRKTRGQTGRSPYFRRAVQPSRFETDQNCCDSHPCKDSPRLAKLPTGPVVQRQHSSLSKRGCGFESRRVHSPFCGEDLYRGENAEIISPGNLTLFPPPPILKLTESCTTFLMTPDIRGHLHYHQRHFRGGPPIKFIFASQKSLT
jgi:hypothetical protein